MILQWICCENYVCSSYSIQKVPHQCHWSRCFGTCFWTCDVWCLYVKSFMCPKHIMGSLLLCDRQRHTLHINVMIYVPYSNQRHGIIQRIIFFINWEMHLSTESTEIKPVKQNSMYDIYKIFCTMTNFSRIVTEPFPKVAAFTKCRRMCLSC